MDSKAELRKRVLLITGGSSAKGYQVATENLLKAMKKENLDLEIIDNPPVGEIGTYKALTDKCRDGVKVVSVYKAFNETCSTLAGTNVVDPANPKDGDIFYNQYLNKNPLRVKYETDGIDFEFLPMFHPLFVLESERQVNSHKYMDKIRRYIGLEPEEKKKKCYYARNYKELYDWVMDRVDQLKDSVCAYDVETNFEMVYSEKLEITGYSLSFTEGEGVYVVLDSLDSKFSDEDRAKSIGLLSWLKDQVSKIAGHNIIMFDTPATYYKFGFEFPVEKLEDTMVFSKLLNGGRIGGNGLKAQSVLRLGYSDWSDIKDQYQEAYSNIVENARRLYYTHKSGKAKKNTQPYEECYNINNYIYSTWVGKDKEGNECANFGKFYQDKCDMELVLLEVYKDRVKVDNIMELAFSKIKDLVEGDLKDMHSKSYSLLPSDVVGQYGALDSIACRELLLELRKVAEEESKEYNVDLKVGYKLWIESHYAAYQLEMNSAKWDHEQSVIDEKIYEGIIKTDLISLITADKQCMRDYVKSKLRNKAVSEYFTNNTEEVKKIVESHKDFRGYTNTGKLRYHDSESDKIKNFSPDDYQKYISIFGVSQNAIHVSHMKMIEEFLSDGVYKMSYADLREFLNPNSDQGKSVLLELLFNEYLLGSKFIIEAYNYVNSESFNVDKANKLLSNNELNLLEIIGRYDKNAKPEDQSKLFSDIMNYLTEIDLGRITSRLINSAGSYRPTTVDEGNMTDLFTLQCVTGINPELDMHRNDEYGWLFAVRRMKKAMKILDTYLNGGKLGRGTLWVVDENTLASGSDIIPRKRKYNGENLEEGECLIVQADWNPNGVLSGRWSGALHTLPSAGDTKRWYKSRFKGGCIAISDYCLTGDTRIPLLDGSEPRIDELVGKEEFYVYSYDEETKKVAVGRAHSARKIRTSYRNLILTLDNGATIECTPEHRFYSYDEMIMKEAQEYSVGDSLLPIRFSTHGGYKAVTHPYGRSRDRVYNLSDRFNIDSGIYDETPECDIHHIDKDRDDDSPTNLERVPSRDHKRAHRMMNWCEESYRSNMLGSVKNQWENRRDEMLSYASKGGSAWAESFNKREDAGLLKSEGLKKSIRSLLAEVLILAQKNGVKVSRLNWEEFTRSQGMDKKGRMLRSVYGQYETFANFLDKSRSEGIITEEFYEECSFFERLYEKAVRISSSKVSILHRTRIIYRAIESSGKALSEETWEEFKHVVGLGVYQKPSWSSIIEFFGSVSNIDRAFKSNHRIVKIEEVIYDEGIDTYCLTVDKYHNFFLSAGVLSSNSQAELRVVAKAAEDKALLEAYESGIDVHLKTACTIFDRGPDTITEVERRYSKMGCHIGGTLIKVSDTESIPIEDIYNSRDSIRYETLSYDIRNRVPVITEPIHVQLTNYVTELTTLTFSNGSTWTGTPDHPFLTRSGLYVRADQCKGQKMVSLGDKVMEVAKVETYPCEPTPVYDLSIPKYHNYLVDLGGDSGVFVHNTFQILYGGTPEGFGNAFLNGDVATAQKIFDGFYKAYPDIKVWMDARHAEIKEKGLVTLLTGRYIRLGFENPERTLSKILKQSGNAPKMDGHYHGNMVV